MAAMVAEQDVLDTQAAGPAAIRGGAIRLGGFGLGSLLSVLSFALMFRHLGVADSGRYVAVLALVALLGGVTDAGLVGIGVREYTQSTGAERALLMRQLLGLRIVLTLVGVLLAVAFAAAAGYDGTLVLGTLLAGSAFLLIAIQSAYSVGLQAHLRMGAVAGADLARQFVNVATVLILVLLGAGLLPFYAANLPAGFVALVATGVLVRGAIPLRPSFDLRRWGSLLRDTVPYAVATAVGAIYFRLAVILVSLIAGKYETGYFGASFRGVEVLVVVPQLLVGSAFPIFSRAARDDLQRLSYALGRVWEVCLLLGVAVAVLLVVGAPFVIDVVAGPSFAPADDVLRIHAVGLVASFVGAAWGYAALGLRQHRGILLSSVAALLTSATLVSILAATGGAVGAAIGTAAAELVLTAGLALSVRGGGIALGVDVSRAVSTVAIGALAAGAGLALSGPGGFPSPVATALALAVYAGGVLAAGAVPEDLVALALGRLRPKPSIP